jgi:hypothetical protein
LLVWHLTMSASPCVMRTMHLSVCVCVSCLQCLGVQGWHCVCRCMWRRLWKLQLCCVHVLLGAPMWLEVAGWLQRGSAHVWPLVGTMGVVACEPFMGMFAVQSIRLAGLYMQASSCACVCGGWGGGGGVGGLRRVAILPCGLFVQPQWCMTVGVTVGGVCSAVAPRCSAMRPRT